MNNIWQQTVSLLPHFSSFFSPFSKLSGVGFSCLVGFGGLFGVFFFGVLFVCFNVSIYICIIYRLFISSLTFKMILCLIIRLTWDSEPNNSELSLKKRRKAQHLLSRQISWSLSSSSLNYLHETVVSSCTVALCMIPDCS